MIYQSLDRSFPPIHRGVVASSSVLVVVVVGLSPSNDADVAQY